MSDYTTKTAADRRSVNVDQADEARDWAERLGVSEEDLRLAVVAVGTSATAVREHLRMKAAPNSPGPLRAADPKLAAPVAPQHGVDPDLQLSVSGAVLGRPDREYGAYGMVKGTSGAEAPSQDERAIRGLGRNRPATKEN